MQSVTYIDLLKSPGGQLCKGMRALTEMCFLLGSSVTGGPSQTMGGVGIRLRSNHFQITGITFTDLSGEQGHASALLCAASIDMRVEAACGNQTTASKSQL